MKFAPIDPGVMFGVTAILLSVILVTNYLPRGTQHRATHTGLVQAMHLRRMDILRRSHHDGYPQKLNVRLTHDIAGF
jgi:hypothetical protein